MKLKLLIAIGSLLIASGIGYLIVDYINLRKENNRISENFRNTYQQLDSVRGKNQELHYTLKGLILDKDELKETQQELVSQLDNMRIKLSRVKNIVQTKYEYITKVDTVFVRDSLVFEDSIKQSKYFSQIKDEYIDVSWLSEVKNQKLLNTNFSLKLSDTLTVVTENQYRGWWIFKRFKGVKVHLKSENPYWSINEIKYIEKK